MRDHEQALIGGEGRTSLREIIQISLVKLAKFERAQCGKAGIRRKILNKLLGIIACIDTQHAQVGMPVCEEGRMWCRWHNERLEVGRFV